MTNKKTTRRALFSSFMALLLCCSMLVGTTFAWFTDSVTSAGNIIKSGTLDVEMTWSDTKDGTYKDASEGAIFDHDLWEPGFTQAKYVNIKNAGTLAFKYQLNIVPNVKPVAGQANLADVIDVYMVPVDNSPAERVDVDTVIATANGTALSELMADPDGAAYGAMLPAGGNKSLLPAELQSITTVGEVTYCIILHMQEEATNEYQDLSVGEGFCVQLLATQLTAEMDSFGPDYDVESAYPVSAGGSAAANGTDDVTVYVKDIKTGETVAELVIPADRTKAETNVSAHVKEQASVDDAVWTVATQEGQAKSFDIHVDGLIDGSEPVAVKLFIGKGLKDPKVYHGQGDPVAYTEITPVSYKNGFVSFETPDFSPFAVIYEKADVSVSAADAWDGTADTSWYNETDTEFALTSAEQLAGLAELVDAGNNFAGKTVKLDSDMDLYAGWSEKDNEPIAFSPIGDESAFEGTFDGQGHTISNLFQGGWQLGYDWDNYGSIGLFGELKDATVKNLTISGAESFVEGGDVGGITGSARGDCVFENITIADSDFATYNNGNGGIIGWSGAGNYTFKNITIAEDVTLAGLWGSFDSSIGGIVGQGETGATYNFENVDIACRLDVYNDCTASYDYYNYRMCGMIIGRLKETTTIDGSNYPDTSKYNITCDDVTVTYDDWANYHYCDPTPGYNNGRGMRVEPGYAYDGLPADYDHSQCTTNHNALIAFDQIFGGAQYGVKGLPAYDGVTVIYNNK